MVRSRRIGRGTGKFSRRRPAQEDNLSGWIGVLLCQRTFRVLNPGGGYMKLPAQSSVACQLLFISSVSPDGALIARRRQFYVRRKLGFRIFIPIRT
jgi:hypothetical protein